MEERIENQENELLEEEVQPKYQPRPVWQVALAWVGVAIVVAAFAIYLYNIATGAIL